MLCASYILIMTVQLFVCFFIFYIMARIMLTLKMALPLVVAVGKITTLVCRV